jgi:hypothetical protein
MDLNGAGTEKSSSAKMVGTARSRPGGPLKKPAMMSICGPLWAPQVRREFPDIIGGWASPSALHFQYPAHGGGMSVTAGTPLWCFEKTCRGMAPLGLGMMTRTPHACVQVGPYEGCLRRCRKFLPGPITSTGAEILGL